jgi:two-component system, chemotaxis family, sensor kinase CheA
VQGRQTIVVRDRVIPLLSLAGSLRYNSDVGRSNRDDSEMIYVVVVSVGERLAGLVVDRLIGEQEVVIKSLGKFIGEIRGISGATILGDGTVALISDAGAMLEMIIEDVQGVAV